MICLDGELKKAEPKTIRYRLLHVVATLVSCGTGGSSWGWTRHGGGLPRSGGPS
jgi:hypothetical protein